MAQETYLVSAVLMGLFVVGVVVAILRLRAWQHYTVRVPRGMATAAAEGQPLDRKVTSTNEFVLPGERVADRLVHSQLMWYLGFVILALGFGAVTVLSLAENTGEMMSTVVLLFLLVLGLYLPVGLYVVLRNRGHASARAVGETAIVLGVVAMIVIVANLVGLG